jgi:outer membrane immunogenic protein
MSRLIAAAAASLLAGPALAADIPARAPMVPAAVVAPGFNWSGIYIGANGGYGSARASSSVTAFGTTTILDSGSLNGAVGGGQIGGNWQFGALVAGLEGDLQWSGQKQTTTFAGITQVDRINTFGTIRGRLGYAFDRWLVYGTGGWAYGTYRSDLTVPLLGTASYSTSRGGLAAGAGIETAFAGNVTAKVEYLYLDTGKITDSTGLAGVTLNTQVKDHIIRLGVNYLFH